MALVKRATKGSKLTIAEMDGNLDFLNIEGSMFKTFTDISTLNLQVNASGAITFANGIVAGTSGYDLTNLSSEIISGLKVFVMPNSLTITSVAGFNLLTSLSDVGTAAALNFNRATISDTLIDSVFTQLPSTSGTVTINVQGCSGAATCNPAIATAKGYIVIT